MPLQIFPKKSLGIDIGTSAIKIVELSSFGGKLKLENYVQIPAFPIQSREAQIRERGVVFLPSEDIAEAISIGLKQANIKTKNCVFSLPDFLTFFTFFTLPPMPPEELEPAIKMEARRHIPVPLKDVTLDWEIIKEGDASSFLTVILVAVPLEIIYKYQKIGELCNLKVSAIEAEVFGLLRIVAQKEKEKTVAILDIGAKSTTCSILDKGILKLYHSLSLASTAITEKLTWELGISWELAEKLKKAWGMVPPPHLAEELKSFYKELIRDTLKGLNEEIDKIFKNFSLQYGKEIDKIIVAGSGARLPGLIEFFKESFQKEIEMVDPFWNISYPQKLKKVLKELAPAFSIATGVALKDLI